MFHTSFGRSSRNLPVCSLSERPSASTTPTSSHTSRIRMTLFLTSLSTVPWRKLSWTPAIHLLTWVWFKMRWSKLANMPKIKIFLEISLTITMSKDIWLRRVQTQKICKMPWPLSLLHVESLSCTMELSLPCLVLRGMVAKENLYGHSLREMRLMRFRPWSRNSICSGSKKRFGINH